MVYKEGDHSKMSEVKEGELLPGPYKVYFLIKIYFYFFVAFQIIAFALEYFAKHGVSFVQFFFMMIFLISLGILEIVNDSSFMHLLEDRMLRGESYFHDKEGKRQLMSSIFMLALLMSISIFIFTFMSFSVVWGSYWIMFVTIPITYLISYVYKILRKKAPK